MITEWSDDDLKSAWDLWDGTDETVEGYTGEEIHHELNRRGLGAYCSV